MPSLLSNRATALCALLIAAASCRSILDIEPGRPLAESGGSAGEGSGGKANTSGSSNGEGGVVEPEGGAPSATAGKGSAGSSQGGTPATAGSSSQAGENAGGAGGNAPINPFPEGACTDCMARNCPGEAAACVDAAGCADGIAEWLACEEPVAEDCVSAAPGALNDLEACGAKSCDVCRHTSDGVPSIEILTPSNGATVQLDETGLIEVSARVHNYTLAKIGGCAAGSDCGHVHFNIDGSNCSVNQFFNAWEPDFNDAAGSFDAQGNVETAVNTKECDVSIAGSTVEIRVSLSNADLHSDRVPLIQSIVTVNIGN